MTARHDQPRPDEPLPEDPRDALELLHRRLSALAEARASPRELWTTLERIRALRAQLDASPGG